MAASALGELQRALTASVTFGRFMKEPLDWERWSTFAKNQIREDVQKHSKPGSVAEKAAFFDAHYKNIASKKDAKPPEKENIAPMSSSGTQGNEAGIIVNTFVEQEEASAMKVISIENPIRVNFSSPKDAPSLWDKVLSGQKKPVYSSKSLSKNGEYNLRSPIKPPPLPGSPEREEIITPKSRKSGGNPMEERRSAPPSLKTKNSSGGAQKNNGTSSPTVPKSSNSRTLKAIAAGILKDRSAQKPPTRVLKQSQATPHPEKRRSKPLPSCSVTGRNISAVGKPPLTSNLSDPLSACTKKSRIPTTSSSLSFRSKERGARCKEKPEERANMKETKKAQTPPRLKVKAENDRKKLHSSTALETSKVKPPNHNTRKVKVENDHKELLRSTALKTKASASKVKLPSNNIKKVKAENEHKKLQQSTKLERRASTSKVKGPSNEKKLKAEKDHKKLQQSTELETKASTSKVKPPSNNVKKVKAENDHKKLLKSTSLKTKSSTNSNNMKKVKAENDHKRMHQTSSLKAKQSIAKTPITKMKKVKAEIDHKELPPSTTLKTKATTRKEKPLSNNNVKKVKPENDPKKLHRSSNLETNVSAIKVKPPSDNLRKVKADDDQKKLRKGTAVLKGKPIEAKPPLNKMKVLPTQPRSPKLGSKRTTISIQDGRHPKSSSSKTNNELTEKNKKKLVSSVASLSSKARK